MHTETVSDILVFKTNVVAKSDVARVAPVLDADRRILQWNIDCEDVDHVLRIKSQTLETADVVSLIAQAGFACEELMD